MILGEDGNEVILILAIVSFLRWRRMSKEKAIEKLREILDRDDLCPKCNIRKRVIEEAMRQLED
jgi:hypothetical protein